MSTIQHVTGQIITQGNKTIIILQKLRVGYGQISYERHKKQPPTIRDQYLLSLMVQGFNHKAIAYNLGLRENTVKRHCHDMYARMGVTNRVQAVIKWQKETGHKFEFEYEGNHHQVLSKREDQVAALITQGDSNKIIADKLELAEGTVRKCTKRVFNKLGVDTRLQVALVYGDNNKKEDK